MSDELYIKYAIAHESICVDGVKLKQGFNQLTDREFNKLSRSKFRTRGIYDLFDQQNEVEIAQKAEADAKTNEIPDGIDDSIDIVPTFDPEPVIEDEEDYGKVEAVTDYSVLSYSELVKYVETAGIKPKSMKKIDILEALKGE